MADINRTKFAFAVMHVLEARGLSYSDAQDLYEGVTKGLLSRVKSGTVISAANMLILCKHLELDPLDYLDVQSRNPFSQTGETKTKVRELSTIIRNISKNSGGSTSCQT